MALATYFTSPIRTPITGAAPKASTNPYLFFRALTGTGVS